MRVWWEEVSDSKFYTFFYHLGQNEFSQKVLTSFYSKSVFKNDPLRTSLVVRWIGIHLPVQGAQVSSLVWEDSTCHRAAKQVHCNYWACFLKPASHNYWSLYALEPILRSKRSHCNEKPVHPIKSSSHLLQLEKACMQQQRPSTTKNK